MRSRLWSCRCRGFLRKGPQGSLVPSWTWTAPCANKWWGFSSQPRSMKEEGSPKRGLSGLIVRTCLSLETSTALSSVPMPGAGGVASCPPSMCQSTGHGLEVLPERGLIQHQRMNEVHYLWPLLSDRETGVFSSQSHEPALGCSHLTRHTAMTEACLYFSHVSGNIS